MTNAKIEFLSATEGKEVLCAYIGQYENWNDEESPYEYEHILERGYTEEQYEQFLKSIDFKYDSGFGGQNLFGYIWYKDGTWSSRGEYDGSEWWNYNKMPPIHEKCK